VPRLLHRAPPVRRKAPAGALALRCAQITATHLPHPPRPAPPRQALRHATPPEGMARTRVLVIRDHWLNVGMGFMPGHVKEMVHFGLATGIHVYFENYGR